MGQVCTQCFDISTFFTDDDTGTCCVDADCCVLRSALNDNLADTSGFQAVFDVVTQFQISDRFKG